jgi:DNA-directed RNA polymerase specialized sigma24 family protein
MDEATVGELHRLIGEALSQDSDEGAFGRLYEFCFPRLCAWLMLRQRVSEDEAKDAVQDAFLGLLNLKAADRLGSKDLRFIAKKALLRLIDGWRKYNRRVAQPERQVAIEISDFGVSARQTFNAILVSEMLNQLPSSQKDLLLGIIQGLGLTESGSEGDPAGTLGRRRSDAKDAAFLILTGRERPKRGYVKSTPAGSLTSH